MTKIVEIKKKAPEHEEIADMLESFATALRENEGGNAEKVSSAVLIYKFDGAGVVFESTARMTPTEIGMMCSAVHIACVYEETPSGDDTVH